MGLLRDNSETRVLVKLRNALAYRPILPNNNNYKIFSRTSIFSAEYTTSGGILLLNSSQIVILHRRKNPQFFNVRYLARQTKFCVFIPACFFFSWLGEFGYMPQR